MELTSVQLYDSIAIGIYAVLLLVTIAMVIQRRHLQPLRFRDPWLLIATVTSTFIANTTLTLKLFIQVTNCFLRLLLLVPMMCMMVFLTFRFWKLLLAFRMTQARLTNKTTTWWLRWMSMTTSRGIWIQALAIIALYFALYLILGLRHAECNDGRPVKVLSMTLLMTYWAAIVVMTWILRHVHDGFFVVRELMMLSPVLLLTNIMIVVTDRFPPVELVFSSIIQLSIQMLFPLWKSYQMAPMLQDLATINGSSWNSSRLPMASVTKSLKVRRQSSGLSRNATFVEILRHPDGFEAMKRFLTLEFSVENLLCWKELHDQKRERRPEQVLAHFNAVYDTFIRKGSLNEVNIPSQLKKHLKVVHYGRPFDKDEILKLRAPKTLQEGSGSLDHLTDVRLRLLGALYHEMIRLMQMDSFQRFKKSQEYRDLIHDDVDQDMPASQTYSGQV